MPVLIKAAIDLFLPAKMSELKFANFVQDDGEKKHLILSELQGKYNIAKFLESRIQSICPEIHSSTFFSC